MDDITTAARKSRSRAATDGQVLFISRVDFDKGVGHLTGYDIKDFKAVADYQIQPGAVHECRPMGDGTILAACSGIRPVLTLGHLKGPRVATGALVRMDISSGRVLDKKLVEDDDQMLGHCHVTKAGTTIALSRPRPDRPVNGKIYFSHSEDAPLQPVKWTAEVPEGVPGECLSVAVSEAEHRAIITNPENTAMLVMDTQEGAFVSKFNCLARGIVFDSEANRFIASGDTLLTLNARADQFSVMPLSTKEASYWHGPFNSPHSLLIPA